MEYYGGTLAGIFCGQEVRMNRKEMEERFFSPKSDVVFKELMRNETVRKYFISDVLDIPLEEIRSVRLENPFLSMRSRLEKQCILDVKMQLNGNRRINVELQIRHLAYWDKRSLFYLAKMYTDGLFSGQRYDRLKKCIVISILDFAGDEHPGCHKVYHLRDCEGRLYSDQFEIHIIELNKKLTGNRLDDWIRLFQVKNREELEKMRSGNAGVMKAVEEVKAMNLFRWAKLRYEEYLKNQRDLWAMEVAAKEDGWKTGMEQGMEQGLEQGIEQGIQRGIEQGMQRGIEQGIEQGLPMGKLDQSRQVIYDFLKKLGKIPEDICMCVDAEQDMETLKSWYMAAPTVKNFEEFRKYIEKI